MVRIVVRMDLERMFLNQFSIKKKPDDIFDLIEAAIGVAEVNYPTQLEKHKDKLLKQLMNSGKYKDDEAIVEEKSCMFQGGEKMNIKNCTGDLRKEETTNDIKGLKKRDFETSKRKFEERFVEEKEAKRRIVMVDFHDMPKPAKDPCAAPRRCWNRRRF